METVAAFSRAITVCKGNFKYPCPCPLLEGEWLSVIAEGEHPCGAVESGVKYFCPQFHKKLSWPREMIRGGNVRHFLWDVIPICQSRFSPLLFLVCLPWKCRPRPIAGAGDCLAPLFSRVAIWSHADEVSNVSWLTSVIWPDRQRHCSQHWPPQLLLFKESAADLWPVRDSGMPTITPHARIKLTICNLYRLNTSASREKHNQPGRVPQEINSKGSQPFFPLSPVLDSSTDFLDFILQLLCTHSISLFFFFFF